MENLSQFKQSQINCNIYSNNYDYSNPTQLRTLLVERVDRSYRFIPVIYCKVYLRILILIFPYQRNTDTLSEISAPNC